jgi:hypothetical protein
MIDDCLWFWDSVIGSNAVAPIAVIVVILGTKCVCKQEAEFFDHSLHVPQIVLLLCD